MLGEIFNLILYQPLFQTLVWLYKYIGDFGLAIIVLTIIIRIILYPLNRKSLKMQKAMTALQPEIKKMQEQHKNDKVKQAETMMSLYKKHKVNPLSGFLPMLIQLPILIALFKVFVDLSKNSGLIDPMFLNIIDLSHRSVILSLLAGATQFWQSKVVVIGQKSAFLYFMPLITVFIGFSLPAGLPLYWITITLFGIGEHYVYTRNNQKSSK